MVPDCDVVVIGSGPYGLAAAAHLRSAHVETRVFGRPMEFWRQQMPVGMLLRSSWEASHISDPHNQLTLDAYESRRGCSLSRPVPLRDFINYGLWFQRQVVPDLDHRKVAHVERTSDGFRVVLEGDASLTCRRVVV